MLLNFVPRIHSYVLCMPSMLAKISISFSLLNVSRVFLDIAEQEYLYELDLNNDKVVRLLKTENLGEEFEIFKMNYSMLVALLTRHVTWSNIEEDIHYDRKPDVHDSNLEFLMNFLAL